MISYKADKTAFRGIGARERVVSKRSAPTDQFGFQIDLTPGSPSKSDMRDALFRPLVELHTTGLRPLCRKKQTIRQSKWPALYGARIDI